VDWASSWGYGMPPKGTKGGSSILDLQLLIAYQQAAELEAKMGCRHLPVCTKLKQRS